MNEACYLLMSYVNIIFILDFIMPKFIKQKQDEWNVKAKK